MQNERISDIKAYETPAVRRCTVLDIGRREVLLKNSPLRASEPGFPGDQGWVGAERIVDVLDDDSGTLHLLSQPHSLRPGEHVPVAPDQNRRERIARTHAATIFIARELDRRGARQLDIEITAGLAWIELDEDPGPLSLDAVVDAGESVRACRARRDRQLVLIGKSVIATYVGPLVSCATDLAGTTVRGVERDEGLFVLEIAVPGGRERWWR